MTQLDAAVVGAGPNGLAAAVILARAGLRVTLYEAEPTIGGGARTAELTLPGFHHDVCSAVHPMAAASRFFRDFELARRIRLFAPAVSYAHPLQGGAAGIAYRDLAATVEALGADGAAWRRIFGPLTDNLDAVRELMTSTLVRVPRHPVTLARLGLRAVRNGIGSGSAFRGDAAPAMLTGTFAHANRALPDVAAAAAGLVLATHAHGGGWVIPEGGSQSIVDAMASDFVDHGGEIVVNARISDLAELPTARATILDVTPRSLAALAGDRLHPRAAARLRRFRYGSAVAKTDFALDGPVPWANGGVSTAGTVHLGGTRDEILASEVSVASGRLPDSPFVLVAQPGSVDPSRAPEGKHVLWAYTHVPTGSAADRTEAITAQIERFAPGFRDRILASVSTTAVAIEEHNANYVGGDIAAGEVSLAQLLRRPTIAAPWRTPIRGVYLCSASTSPGPGVHGLGGWNAAREALAREFGVREMPSLGVAT